MFDIATMAAPKRSARKLTGGTAAVKADKSTEPNAPKAPVEKYVLANGNAYSKAFCVVLNSAMKKGIKKMIRDDQYTAAEIFGRSWPKDDPGACKQAGEILVDMVRRGAFPTIRVAKTKHEYPIKYELI